MKLPLVPKTPAGAVKSRGAVDHARSDSAVKVTEASGEAAGARPEIPPQVVRGASHFGAIDSLGTGAMRPTLKGGPLAAGATVSHLGGFKHAALAGTAPRDQAAPSGDTVAAAEGVKAEMGAGPLSPAFQEALTFAADLHVDQVRRGTNVPYMSHLMQVAGMVLDAGGTETEAIAGLLHDAVEDQGGAPTLARITAQFGQEVADIVAGCSDTDVEPKPPWLARKQAYIGHLAEASPSVRLVSGADKLHNVSDLTDDYLLDGDATFERFNGKKDGTLWYYRACADVLLDQGPPNMAAKLDRAVRALEALVAADAGGR